MDDDRSDGVVPALACRPVPGAVAEALDIDRKTIRKYLAPAVAAGLTPGEGGKFDEPLWWELITGWFPEVGDRAARAVTWPAIAAHHDWIDAQLKASVTIATIAQRLRDHHGVAVSESTVRRYVAAQFAEKVAESKVTVARRPGHLPCPPEERPVLP
ncbi:hypothetical protein R1CP_33440 [Rhodococcus opacus]|uniref:Transposase n=1 Tax=Rhodococcus opacus TaxID=37919 RepID=A0A1B1KFA6_RHOOP|nr:hypothetical protein R1CP_33440 [Rhodococcus opacus]